LQSETRRNGGNSNKSIKKAEKAKELKKTKHLGYLMVGSETNEKDLPSATATAVELLMK
jgi:hypothetical protein